ncbi:TIM-barrel domain-containing protein [Telmatobacter bradus]|uniref:glycoside hydrolase family 31 protein n=1 Tax=Telmatobacter bradus TaxID=474953 RepID=UPI003B42C02C
MISNAQSNLIETYPHPAAMSAEKTASGLKAHNEYDEIELSFSAPGILHVQSHPAGSAQRNDPRPWIEEGAENRPSNFVTYSADAERVQISTAEASAELNLGEGSLRIKSPDGKGLLQERGDLPRTYQNSEATGLLHVIERFSPDATEALYGLGQHQSGLFNYRGSTVELGQNNTDISIPLLLSSKGYGILWNTASFGYVDNRFPLELNFEAMAVDHLDYYVLIGPEFDKILHEYRTLTGHAPLLPEWAYGFIQSKDRYKTQAEMQDVAAGYRSRHIPMDGLVQDWFWWQKDREGDPLFNEGYTDVPAELKTLHDEHVHALISVWGLMDSSSKNYQELAARGYEIPGTHVYDPSNPAGRDYYWQNLPGKLFQQGWDGFWLDSAEPEEVWPHMGDAILRYKPLSIGNGLEYTNMFAFQHNLGVQEHWKQTSSEKRVLLLTRSAFLGQQRVGAMVWSGDVYSSWWALRHQVPAGLNFALSGYPYWTTDIGGYHPVGNKQGDMQADRPEYQELYARWFEYGAFCPIFRTHGHRDHNELWSWDQKIVPALVDVDKLHYRLMPYLYAQAWRVTNEDSTIQRPLVMDFRMDENAREISDQFLYGPAIMVSPVLREHATSRPVYLPKGAEWFDFWTGKKTNGGTEIVADAPLSRIPLHVRAGSIVPMGPEIEYTGEKSDPIELRIYSGADASFDLYEDEGDSYRYEQGAHAITPIRWNDASHTLEIGDRQGSYKGMAEKHSFHVVLVRENHGVGEGVTVKADRTVEYTGKKVEAKF